MTNHKDRDKNKSKPSRLTREEAALWREVTRDVERFKGRHYEEGGDELMKTLIDPPRKTAKAAPTKPPAAAPAAAAQGREIDHRSAERLRKGQMPIDARLDLHGMNQGAARQALHGFIMDAYARGHRCVLVITGKGRTGKTLNEMDDSKPGILKRNVPLWLHEGALGAAVLKAVPARPQHGGDGALYVLLRRKR